MIRIAGIAEWHGRHASAAELRRMLRATERPEPVEPEIEVIGAAALGHSWASLDPSGPRQPQTAWLPDRSRAVVADGRLYNRTELRSALARVEWLPRAPSDAALILAGYELWQERLLERLRGDFAFALWDAGVRRLFAARDPFGARPFFYAPSPRRLCFGSEPKQLLVLPGVPVEPDARSVAEFLADRMGARRRTCFRGIERLRAGHLLRAQAGRIVQEPYWHPPAEAPLPRAAAHAYRARLRELLFDAVERRLGADAALFLELSGGLDSSALVLAAGEVYRRNGGPLPAAETLSAVFPGREFDETPFVSAVADRVPFASHRITPNGDDVGADLAAEAWAADSPDADLARVWKREASELLSARGARTLIAGTGGDELFSDPDLLRDLLARRRWRLALRYRRCRAAALPPVFSRVRRALGRPAGSLPAAARECLRPELIAELRGRPERPVRPARPELSGAQRQILEWLSDPRFHYVLEQNEARWRRHGVELRHPLLDRELVEFVLATPAEVRAAMGGPVKSYLASALSDLLPRLLLDRGRKTAYDGYYAPLAESATRRITELLRGEPRWECERYVRPGVVRALLERPAAEGRSWSAVRPLWAVACLEVWLRQLPRYGMMGKEVQSA